MKRMKRRHRRLQRRIGRLGGLSSARFGRGWAVDRHFGLLSCRDRRNAGLRSRLGSRHKVGCVHSRLAAAEGVSISFPRFLHRSSRGAGKSSERGSRIFLTEGLAERGSCGIVDICLCSHASQESGSPCPEPLEKTSLTPKQSESITAIPSASSGPIYVASTALLARTTATVRTGSATGSRNWPE